MQIVWANLTILDRYVTGDQWGPLVKLYTQDYEIHLHMNVLGSAVTSIGMVRNIVSRIRLNRYNDDVAPANRWAQRPVPPSLGVGQALFVASGLAAVPTTYHQWLRTETTGNVWTLNCGRAQEPRMRGNKPQHA